MTTFDLSGGGQHSAPAAPAATGSHPALGADDPHAQRNPEHATDSPTSAQYPDPQGAGPEGDALALLTAKASEVQESLAELCDVYGINRQFRLRCTTHVDEKPMRNWQRAAVPVNKRKGGQISQFEVDNFVLASRVLLGTTRELAVWSDKAQGYVDIPSEETCPFQDRKVLAALGEMLPANAVRKVFGGKESLVIMASSRVMAYAGWNPDESFLDDVDTDDDDELDPTPGR